MTTTKTLGLPDTGTDLDRARAWLLWNDRNGEYSDATMADCVGHLNDKIEDEDWALPVVTPENVIRSIERIMGAG